MPKYLCKHGYMYASCELCVALDEAIDDFMVQATVVDDEAFAEMMYDHYLDEDERILRESEGN